MARAAAFALTVLSALAWGGCVQAADPPPKAAAAQAAAPTARADAPVAETGASIFVTGNPMAQACENAAQFGDVNKAGIDACTLLLQTPSLSDSDRVATYIDRGGIYMQHKRFAEAQADFEEVIKIRPDLGNAYINRGAALIGQKRYAEGIAEIDKGFPLNPDQPEKAYFNRAIADEAMGDRKAAAVDYQKALTLQPKWTAPKAELQRLAAIAAAKGE